MSSSTAAILRPEILVIGNRSYRINSSSLPGLEFVDSRQMPAYREEEETDYNENLDQNMYNDDNDEPSCRPQVKTTTMELEDKSRRGHEDLPAEDDGSIEFLAKENVFVSEMDIASAFYGVLIGKNAENKQKLEQETKTQIAFPRRDNAGPVIIRGKTKASVQSARTRIELAIDRNRQIQPFTHFLSIPIGQLSSDIKNKFDEFKRNVLEQCGKERGVSLELFQQAPKLHLTIGTFVLLSQSEVDYIKETLVECTQTLLRELMPTDKERFIVHLKGLEFMNDDPSFVDVLYAKVQLVDENRANNRLQIFLNRLNEELFGTGLMKQQEIKRIKLHVTLMNSLLRKDQTGILEAQKTARGRVKNAERESFDAQNILRLFGTFDFGQVVLGEMHLSIMHEPDRVTGYYGCETKVLLAPVNNR